jgi:hypothetical protein
MSDTREQVHELVDRIPPSQLPAVAGLLKAMLDDEESEFDAADHQRLRECEARIAAGEKGTSMEDFLAEFGLKLTDFPLEK